MSTEHHHHHRENVRAGWRSLALFAASVALFTTVYITEIYLIPSVWKSHFWSPILYLSVINIFLKLYFTGFVYSVSVRAIFLGFIFSTGVYLSCFDDGWKLYGFYMSTMAFFHFSEFFTTAIFNPSTLSIDSYILNHSPQYGIAALSCTIEWALENYFFPDLKKYFTLSYVGLTMCICGELLRKGAMFTAKTNFNHMVQFVKTEDHTLVTHGIYSFFRHPSYVGWFYWAIGTQIVLLNPICFLGFTAASWFYFRERIYMEEYTLLNFFGKNYVEYQENVPTGIPFIEGYVL